MEFNSCRRRCTTNHKMCEQDPWAGPDVEDLEGGRRKGGAASQVAVASQQPVDIGCGRDVSVFVSVSFPLAHPTDPVPCCINPI
jgi:hypothetical protein